MSVRRLPPPRGLGRAGAGLWRQIAAQWAADGFLPDARERRLLQDAGHEADVLALMAAELRAVARSGSLTVAGSAGQAATHPLIDQCRKSRALIASLLSRLGFDDPAVQARPGRGSRTTRTSARAAAMARHHPGA